jgi:hypothetical protein
MKIEDGQFLSKVMFSHGVISTKELECVMEEESQFLKAHHLVVKSMYSLESSWFSNMMDIIR